MSVRNRDGFLTEAELMRPLNTYHTSGSSTDRGRNSWTGRRSAEYAPQQGMMGPMPAVLGGIAGMGHGRVAADVPEVDGGTAASAGRRLAAGDVCGAAVFSADGHTTAAGAAATATTAAATAVSAAAAAAARHKTVPGQLDG